MHQIDMNNILNREDAVLKIKEVLTKFELNKHNNLLKKGIYIYGEPGSGKTMFVMNILKEIQKKWQLIY